MAIVCVFLPSIHKGGKLYSFSASVVLQQFCSAWAAVVNQKLCWCWPQQLPWMVALNYSLPFPLLRNFVFKVLFTSWPSSLQEIDLKSSISLPLLPPSQRNFSFISSEAKTSLNFLLNDCSRALWNLNFPKESARNQKEHFTKSLLKISW